MTDLITRLESADGPDRELDAEIAKALGFLEEVAGMVRLPTYTASIDAALTLVPEGCSFELDNYEEMAEATVCRGRDFYGGMAKTPALALAAAALKARGV